MRVIILSAILAVLIMAQVGTRQAEGSDAFKFVCQELEAMYGENCGGIPPPILVTSLLPALIAFDGVYIHGEPYIFLSSEAPEKPSVIIHETTHYVAFNMDLGLTKCEGEALARLIAKEEGAWRAEYGCDNEDTESAS